MVRARARAGRGPPAEAGASGVSGEMKGRKGQPVSPGHSGQKEPHVARFLGEDRGGGGRRRRACAAARGRAKWRPGPRQRPEGVGFWSA